MNTKKFTMIIILLVFILSLFIVGYFQYMFLPTGTFHNEPLHSSIEMIGVLAAVLLGTILLQRHRLETDNKLLWMITGLFIIAILDGFHALVKPGNNFVFLHSSSMFFGGLFFSFVWFSELKKVINYKTIMMWLIVLFFTLLSISALLFPDIMPQMLYGGKFTTTATFLNIFGGILFIVASIFFLKNFYKTSEKELYWFACFSLLFGLSGITFIYGEIWTSAWWFWHVLRLAAFVIVLSIVIKTYQESILNLHVTLSELQRAEEIIQEARDYAESIVNTVSDSLLVLNSSMKVISANQSYYKTFKTSSEETGVLFDINNRCWDMPELRELLTDVLKNNSSFDSFEVECVFPEIGHKIMLLNARQIQREAGEDVIILLAIRDITEKKRMEQELNKKAQEILDVSTPILKIWDGVVAVPLIGTLDSQRTQQLMDRLLNSIIETSSQIAIVDITGVPVIDTQTAQHLIETINSVKLLGSKAILTGVSPSIAVTLVHLGIDLSNIITCSTLLSGLQSAINSLDEETTGNNDKLLKKHV